MASPSFVRLEGIIGKSHPLSFQLYKKIIPCGEQMFNEKRGKSTILYIEETASFLRLLPFGNLIHSFFKMHFLPGLLDGLLL